MRAISPGSGHPQDAVLLVQLGGRRYGVPLVAVERILPMAYVRPLPDTDPELVGMLNLHGDAVPVIDPRQRLGLDSPPVSADHRLVLVRIEPDRPRFLLWVDGVEDVVLETADALSSVPSGRGSALAPRVLRVGDDLVPVLAPRELEPRIGPER